ncbi:MAG: hypothetical protein K5695_12635 [Oscillospiraceae bacterium]|nr:hypothetical protein [Oscillospiraceae bacterium]
MEPILMSMNMRRLLLDDDFVRGMIYAESEEETRKLLKERGMYTAEDLRTISRVVDGFLTGELNREKLRQMCFRGTRRTGLARAAGG